MDLKLVMFKRDGRRKDFKIQKERTVIGRGEECSLRIPLLSVSRQHCELLMGGDELRVRDLASSNGTYVNNRRVNESGLRAGDRLSIGPVIFTLQIDGAPAEITPIKSRAQKAAQAEAGPRRPGEEEGVVELEADVVEMGAADAEDSDPIAALEALAEQSKKEKQQE
jgi:pSer/pThr/pTyr-binding forkhead associated (FHA) protein